MARRRLSLCAGAVVVTLMLLAGCGGGRGGDASLPVGTSQLTLTVDGTERSVLVTRPQRLAEPAPLVLMLHGGVGSARQAQADYGWDSLADVEGVIVAYPDGQDRAWSVGAGCCGQPGAAGVDDVAFLEAVVRRVGDLVPVDEHRIFATGMSNGGLMAYRLACESDLFAAIGPTAATLVGECPDPAPVSVIAIHGTADEQVRYDGDVGTGRASIDGAPVPELHAFWQQVSDCGPAQTSTDATVTASRAECPGGRAVALVTVDGAGHQWPGARQPSRAREALGADEPSSAIDATETIWEFFAAHPSS